MKRKSFLLLIISIMSSYGKEMTDTNIEIRSSALRIPRDTSTSPFKTFSEDISALARILTGLNLEVGFKKGSVDVLEVMMELLEVEMDRSLVAEIASRVSDWEQLEGQVEQLGTGASVGQGWDRTVLDGGMTTLRTLVAKIKQLADQLDDTKTTEILDLLADFKPYNLTELGNKVVEQLKNAFDVLKDTADTVPGDQEKDVLTKVTTVKELATRVGLLVNLINETVAPFYATKMKVSSDTSTKKLFQIVEYLKQSNSEIAKLAQFISELSKNGKITENLMNSANSTKAVAFGSEKLILFVDTSNSARISDRKNILGFPNGLVDMAAITRDVNAQRNRDLLSGGKNMTQLDAKWVSSLKPLMEKAVSSWTATRGAGKLEGFTTVKSVSEQFTSSISNIQTSINFSQTLADFSNSFEKIAQLSSAGQFENHASVHKELETSMGSVLETLWPLNAAIQKIKYMGHLVDFAEKIIINSTAKIALSSMRLFPNFAEIVTEVNNKAIEFEVNDPTIFTKLLDASSNIPSIVPDMKELYSWSKNVKAFTEPTGFDVIIDDMQSAISEANKLDTTLANSLKKVVEEVKNLAVDLSNLQSAGKTLAVTSKSEIDADSIKDWKELPSVSKTIGRTARNVFLLENIGEQMAELRSIMGGSTKQEEIKALWSEFETCRSKSAEVQKRIQAVHSVSTPTTSYQDYTPIIEKMLSVSFPKLDDSCKTILNIDTQAISDAEVAKKVNEMKNCVTGYEGLSLEYASHSQSVSSAPDAFQSVSLFFSSLFNLVTTTSSALSDSVTLIIIIVVVVLLVVFLCAAIVYFYKKNKSRKITNKMDAINEKNKNAPHLPPPEPESYRDIMFYKPSEKEAENNGKKRASWVTKITHPWKKTNKVVEGNVEGETTEKEKSLKAAQELSVEKSKPTLKKEWGNIWGDMMEAFEGMFLGVKSRYEIHDKRDIELTTNRKCIMKYDSKDVTTAVNDLPDLPGFPRADYAAHDFRKVVFKQYDSQSGPILFSMNSKPDEFASLVEALFVMNIDVVVGTDEQNNVNVKGSARFWGVLNEAPKTYGPYSVSVANEVSKGCYYMVELHIKKVKVTKKTKCYLLSTRHFPPHVDELAVFYKLWNKAEWLTCGKVLFFGKLTNLFCESIDEPLRNYDAKQDFQTIRQVGEDLGDIPE